VAEDAASEEGVAEAVAEEGVAEEAVAGGDAEREPGEVLVALADPTRRHLLAELAARGTATGTELAEQLPVSRQAVVKHLAVLSRAGLVAGQREGREVRYVARPEGLAATARWMAELAAEWDQRLRDIKRIAESGD
jgi:DNA-binding transcriptional ArsR family regulator